MTKKIFMTMLVALMALTATEVKAQVSGISPEEQYNAMIGLMQMFRPVGKEYAVTCYPMTWREYRIISGKKMPRGTSISTVVSVGSAEQKRVADLLTKNDGNGVKYRVASGSELQKALQKRINIQSENAPFSISSRGFYLAISYKDYLKIQRMLQAIGEAGGVG